MSDRNLDLFPAPSASQGNASKLREDAPLAERLRPQRWEDFLGLDALDPALIRQLREGQGRPPSLIFWGPPGSGKTTLSRLIGQSYQASFVEVSAVLVGVKEIREIAQTAASRQGSTILFVDEIHRLNKAQQDAFLPHVERGTFVLLGATTENPSFTLTNALRSRARVVVLPELSVERLRRVVERGAVAIGAAVSDEALALLAQVGGGDARQVLNILEAVHAAQPSPRTAKPLTKQDLEQFFAGAGRRFYDRAGEEHYNMASAFIKSMRGSNPDAALYWCFRMIESGEDPRFLIRRMMIFSSEDIGNADPRALPLAVATHEAFERLGLPEGKIPIAQCVTYLACAPKSNRSYRAMHEVLAAIEEQPKISVPLHLRNAPTNLMKDLGYSDGYQYPHDHEAGFVEGVQYLPEPLKDRIFYEPTDRGLEKAIGEKLSQQRRPGKPKS